MQRQRRQAGLWQRPWRRAGDCAGTLVLMFLSGVAAAQLNCNVGVEFYPEGGIKSCKLNGDHRVYTAQGRAVTCADGYVAVQFPGGRLKSCTLAATFVYDALRCTSQSRIEFRRDGTVSKCEPR